MGTYRCIHTLQYERNGICKISKGSHWEYDSGYVGESDVRMYTKDGDDDSGYIVITDKEFKTHFTRVA